jgi:hypothetical protein
MTISSELLHRYNEIISGPVISSTCTSGECVSMLYETPWVRVMIVRYQVAPTINSIEIELSLPHHVIELAFPSTKALQEQAHKYIDCTIDHLNYLLKLQSAGFSLGILSTEGIWSAVLKVKELPDLNLFETLVPPEMGKYPTV